jgi:acetyl-CoA acetyltransferase
METVAIIGIGDSNLYRRNTSPLSAFGLALAAVIEAADDAGLNPQDIDGMCSFGLHAIWAGAVADAIGTKDLRFAAGANQLGGSGMVGSLQAAVAALEAGRANYVVLYKSIHSGESRVSAAGGYLPIEPRVRYQPGYEGSYFGGSFTAPYGVYIPYEGFALSAQRYMHDYGVTSDDLYAVASTIRRHAVKNKRARFFGADLARSEYDASPMVADPLRRLDLCQENDFGVAFVLTTMDRAKDSPHTPVRVATISYALGLTTNHGIYGDPALPSAFMRRAAKRLWAESGYKKDDIRCLSLFDSTTASILMQLEDLGFCGPGEAPAMVREGHIRVEGGSIPVNPSGGQLSEAYAIGMTVLAEGVRQVRGTSVNQIGWPALVAHSPYSSPTGLIVLDR